MSYIKKYLLAITFFSTMVMYSSEEQLVYSHGQKGLYCQKSLTLDIYKNIQDMKIAFASNNYRLASLLGVSTQRYPSIMGLPQLDPHTKKDIYYIIAHSHIKLRSPQHALTAFEKIHDQETTYGTLTSADIANCLQDHIEMLPPTHHTLAQKLSSSALVFEKYAKELRLKSYKQEYENLDLQHLINKARIISDNERLEVIISCIKKHAKKNDMRALCIMTTAYNTGQYGVSACQKSAFKYAQRYVTLLAQNPATIPLEHFGIKHALSNIDKQNIPSQSLIFFYYNYLQAIRQNEIPSAQDAINKIKQVKDIVSPLRAIILEIFAIAHNIKSVNNTLIYQIENNIIRQLQELETHTNFNEILATFVSLDGKIVTSLLHSLISIENAPLKSIYYFLALLAYHQENPDYTTAKNYFELSGQHTIDIVTNYNYVLCNKNAGTATTADQVNSLIPLIKKVNGASKKQARNNLAYTLLYKYLTMHSIDYINQLFNQNNLELAHTFSTLLLEEPKSASLIINMITQLQKKHTLSKNHDNSYTLNHFYCSKIYPSLLKLNKQNHSPKDCLMLAQLLVGCLDNPLIDTNQHPIIIQNIKTTLKEIEKKPLFVKTERSTIAHLYSIIGKQSNNTTLLDKAIAYGNVDAYYHKAIVLLKQPLTKKKEYEIIELLKKHAKSTSPLRTKSLNKLGELYFEYTTQKNLLTYISPSDTQAFHYLKQAADQGNFDACGLLAILYTQGIRQKTAYGAIWINQPNNDKALEFFQHEKCLTAECAIEILFSRGITYYNNLMFESALKDFEQISPSLLSNYHKATLLIYHISSLLLSNGAKEKFLNDTDPELNRKVLTDLYNILEIDECDFSLLNEDIQSILTEKTLNIISQKNVSQHSIFLCSAVGTIFSIKFDHSKENKDILDHGAKCLRYSADQGEYMAQINTSHLKEEYLSQPDSIEYLLNAYEHARINQIDGSCDCIEELLLERLPKTIAQQYYLFEYYSICNKPATACHLLNILLPFNKKIIFFDESPESRIKLIADYNKNTLLKELTQKFMASPETSSLTERYAAILSSCIYLYSNKKADLNLSVRYLSALQKLPNFISFSQYLGLAYYKLATILKEENVPFLYAEYLKKSADYENTEAITMIIKEYTNKNPFFTSISQKSMQKWSQCIEENNQTIDPLIGQLCNTINCSYSSDEKYTHALNISSTDKTLGLLLLKKLAEQSHPHATFYVAMSDPNSKMFKEYVIKCFNKGIIKRKGQKQSVFIDFNMAYLINTFIKNTIQNSQNPKPVLSFIINELISYNININNFKKLLLNTHNIDINHYI